MSKSNGNFVNYKNSKDFKGFGYTGADIKTVFRFPKFVNIKPVEFGEVKVLSYSTYRDKFPVRSMGFINPKGYTKSTRTIAGSIIFSIFEKNMINSVIENIYGSKKYNILPDELPPFSIDLNFVNEYRNTNKISIIGAEIAEGNQILSIDQMNTDETYSFVAQDLVMLDKDPIPASEYEYEKSVPNINDYPNKNNIVNENDSPNNYYLNSQPKSATDLIIEKNNNSEQVEKGEPHERNEDLELLTKVINGEARGESFEGQVAVGAVVLNRVSSPEFPNTIKEVVYQAGQFDAVDDGQIDLKPTNSSYRAAQEALSGSDPSNGALFYYNPAYSGERSLEWFKTRNVSTIIGQHVFTY